jgi:hypothetical protein
MKDIILNVPMSPSLQQIIERPIDSGDPAAYLVQVISGQ